MDERGKNKHLFWGIALVLLGLVVLLGEAGFYSHFIHEYIYRWESGLILIGILLLVIRQKIFGGVSLIGLGAYFLLDDLSALPIGWERWFFPAILILIGFALVLTTVTSCNRKN